MAEDMLEFVFFHKVLAEKFIDKVKSHDIVATLVHEEPAWEVHIPEDIDETADEELNDYYDDLFADDQDMYEQEHEADEGYQAAAIELTLGNGERVYAQTDQKIMGKLLSILTFDELNRLVNDIVFAVENPDSRTICQRHRDLKEMEE